MIDMDFSFLQGLTWYPKWIKNWFGDRRQRVVVMGCFSDRKFVTLRVLQVLVLGPLLLVIYTNDFENVG